MRILTMRPLILSLGLCSVLCVSVAHAAPSAADRETARSLLKEGDRLFAAKDFAGALRAYAGADALMHVPSTSVEVAKAEASLGQLIEARETCLQVGRQAAPPNEPKAMKLARQRCQDLSRSVEQRIPSLQIRVVPSNADPEISIDGVVVPAGAMSLPRRLNPGQHVVVARASGFVEKSQEVALVEAQNASLELTLEPVANIAVTTPPPPPREPQVAPEQTPAPPTHEEITPRSHGLPTYAWVGFGVAGVGVAVGTVTGIVSLGAASDAKSLCTGNSCPTSAQSKIDSSITFANVSNVAFAVGLVGAVVGVVGWLTHRGDASPHAMVNVTPWLGHDAGGLRGTF